MSVGDPLDPKTEMGSQISQAQMDRILTYIQSGVERAHAWSAEAERDVEGDKAGASL